MTQQEFHQEACRKFKVGEKLSDFELRVMFYQFTELVKYLEFLTEYDIARRAAIHDLHRLEAMVKGRGIKDV